MNTPTLNLTGNLSSPDAIPVVLQMLIDLKRTALLHVHTPRGRGVVFFELGQFRHVSYGPLHSDDALAQLLLVREGTFETASQIPTPPPAANITGSSEQILMRAAIAADHLQREPTPALPPSAPDEESAALLVTAPFHSEADFDAALDTFVFEDTPSAAPLPGPDLVPELNIDLNVTTETFPGQVWRLLNLIDGRRTVQELSDVSATPLPDVQRILSGTSVTQHVQYLERMMPPQFWTDVQDAATDVLGIAAGVLLKKAAKTLDVTRDTFPLARAPLWLDALTAAAPPDRQAQVLERLNAVRHRYRL